MLKLPPEYHLTSLILSMKYKNVGNTHFFFMELLLCSRLGLFSKRKHFHVWPSYSSVLTEATRSCWRLWSVECMNAIIQHYVQKRMIHCIGSLNLNIVQFTITYYYSVLLTGERREGRGGEV